MDQINKSSNNGKYLMKRKGRFINVIKGAIGITSVISCINKMGIVSVVISLEHAVFKMLRRPRITACLELMSSEEGEIQIKY